MPNDRSTERLLQRKQVAEEAGKAHPGEWGTDIRYNLKMTAVCADNGEPLCIVTDDEDVATATHIALSDPGTTQQDIEEIIKLRAENERLRGEVEMLNKAVNGWQDEYESAQRCADIATQQVLLLAKKLFDNHICHKAVLCKQGNINGRKFEGEDGCGFCWEEWAWHLAAYDIEDAARKSVEEKNG